METELKHEFTKQANKMADIDAQICGQVDAVDYKVLKLDVEVANRIRELEARVERLESGTVRWVSLS